MCLAPAPSILSEFFLGYDSLGSTREGENIVGHCQGVGGVLGVGDELFQPTRVRAYEAAQDFTGQVLVVVRVAGQCDLRTDRGPRPLGSGPGLVQRAPQRFLQLCEHAAGVRRFECGLNVRAGPRQAVKQRQESALFTPTPARRRQCPRDAPGEERTKRELSDSSDRLAAMQAAAVSVAQATRAASVVEIRRLRSMWRCWCALGR